MAWSRGREHGGSDTPREKRPRGQGGEEEEEEETSKSSTALRDWGYLWERASDGRPGG
ncbi:hypothetical protein SCP_0116320 [Sparassis crispa]|uniref:Uncharacterized protein n=1 Tax=Sparassis crispa TaxID=139825 RepID=A0A401G999_9APHY|nr:hypothetical protein SCP_0116320 [Sparassis crispa]GBE78741.1 hypothetical protein SCP_0116320 [Sparassis crispa]